MCYKLSLVILNPYSLLILLFLFLHDYLRLNLNNWWLFLILLVLIIILIVLVSVHALVDHFFADRGESASLKQIGEALARQLPKN